MAGPLILERVSKETATAEFYGWWYYGLCAECGWITEWDFHGHLVAFDVREHEDRFGHAAELLRTKGDGKRRPPGPDRPKVKVAKAKLVWYQAVCSCCEFKSKFANRPSRPETSAYTHNQRTGHAIKVRRIDCRSRDYADAQTESRWSGAEQGAMF